MKKFAEVATPQIDLAAEIAEIKATQVAILARLEKLDPQPKLETIEPYGVGSTVYSIIDQEAKYPLTVMGYNHRTHRILVQGADDMERPLPLESVQPLSKCRNAAPTAEQAEAELYQNTDAVTREWLLGRRKAQIEAITKPSTPSVQPQYRYGDEAWQAAK